MPDYTPISPPALSADFTLPAVLTTGHEEMVNKVRDHFSNPDYRLPGIEEKGELTDVEKFWLSHECLLRYLRATKWISADKAILRLEGTLKWRREFGIHDTLTPNHVEPEALTGKLIPYGFDSQRRPALYMIPSRQNTNDPIGQIQFTVWTLERCIDLMGPGVETLNFLINYADKAKNPSITVARTVLNILQDHYPERLGLALILNVPFLLNAFYKLITPFVDPVTRPKMKFNPEVVKEGIFQPDMLMKEWWGGGRDFIYEHDKYWPALVSMCEKRKKEQMEGWKRLGGTVGLKEWDYKMTATSDKVAESVGGESEKEKEPTTHKTGSEPYEVTLCS